MIGNGFLCVHKKPNTFSEKQRRINDGYKKLFVVSGIKSKRDGYAFTECDSLVEAKVNLSHFVDDGFMEVAIEVYTIEK